MHESRNSNAFAAAKDIARHASVQAQSSFGGTIDAGCLSEPIPNKARVRRTVLLKSPPHRSEATDLSSRSEDAATEISLLVEASSDGFSQIVLGVREFAAKVVGAQGVRCEVTVQPDLGHLPLSPEKCHQISLMFKGALNDIAHPTRCAAVALSISVTQHELLVEIRDDGCGLFGGISCESGGRGAKVLRRMQARIVEAGGALELATTPRGGALVTLTVPLRN